MNICDLGYNDNHEKFRIDNNLADFDMGRIIAEHKERYMVGTNKGEFEAEITGNLRFTARNREDFPAVGDWVALTIYDSGFALIHNIFPRRSIIKRQAVGQFGEVQIIASNIDFAFIVQAVDRDFNINRLERYLTICYSSKVNPVFILSKIDLIENIRLKEILDQINERIKQVPVFTISNETWFGYEELKSFIREGKTYCLLGSSGVGKSTLLNNLSEKPVMKTGEINQSTNKGKHVTSHRELIILKNGGILIDNPGMREVGIADSSGGLETTFDTIARLSAVCRFKDCTHTGEIGCAVFKAIEDGEIDEASYENYLKLEKEKEHFEATIVEKRKKDKMFGKMVKNFKKDIKRNKY